MQGLPFVQGPVVEALATGAWLDRRRVRFTAFAMLVATIASIVWLFAGRTGTLDAWGRPIGTDFSDVWTAGRMALEGRAAAAYDWGLHYKMQQELHGSATVPFYGWHYPPLFLLLAAPLATLPYLTSLALWQLTTLALALAVVRRILPGRDTLLVALAFPAVFVCLTHGHNGFLTAFLFGAGLLCLDRRPILAGICLGCLAYKPQLGLVIPLALVAGGHWRAIAAAAVTVLGLVLATLAAFGPEVWTAFFASTHLTETVVLEQGATGWFKIQSAFAFARMEGAGIGFAYALQGVVSACVVVASAALWWIGAPFRLRAAALMAGALLATPYVLDYDMVLLGPAMALLVAHGREHGARRWEMTAIAAAWLAPAVARQLALAAHLPAGLLAMSWLFVLIARRGFAEARIRRLGSSAPAGPSPQAI